MGRFLFALVALVLTSCGKDNEDPGVLGGNGEETKPRYITVENGDSELNLYLHNLSGWGLAPSEKCKPIPVYGDEYKVVYMWQYEDTYNDTLKIDLSGKPYESTTNFKITR